MNLLAWVLAAIVLGRGLGGLLGLAIVSVAEWWDRRPLTLKQKAELARVDAVLREVYR